MRATPSRSGAAVTLLAVAAAVFLWPVRAAALDTLIPNDQNYQNHHAKNLPAPAGLTEPLRLNEFPVGPCIAHLDASRVATCLTLPDPFSLISGSLGLKTDGTLHVVGGQLSVNGTGGLIADAPLVFSGLHLQLTVDGTSLNLSGSALQRKALTGAVTAADGSGTTAFGVAGAHAVLGVAGGSTAVPTFIGPAATGDFFGDFAGSLGWGAVPWGSVSGAPTPDGVTIGLSGSAYQRLALTGAVTSAAGSAATVFGPQTGNSIFGVTGSSPAIPAPIIASVANTVPLYDGTSWGWKLLTPLTSGSVATWSAAGVRVFAVNPSGIDSNACWADSPDRTQASVQVAVAAAAATPCATLGGAASEIPLNLAGRTADVFVSGGTGSGQTYADPWSVFDRWGGTVVIVGTGTNSTCGATAFTNSTNDQICLGARTSAGMNAAGYHPTSSTTSNTIQLVKAGGGSPGFGTEPAKPLFVRARFDVATTTAAQRNIVYSVVQVIGSDTIVIPTSIAFASTDTIYLEDPGPSAPGGPFFGTTNFQFSGVAATSILSFQGGVSFASVSFVQGTNSFNFIGSGEPSSTASGVLTPFPQVGPSRFSFISATGGQGFYADNSIASTGGVSFSGLFGLTWGRYNYVGGDATLTGVNCRPFNSSSPNFGPRSSIVSLTPGDAARVSGTLFVSGSRLVLGALNLPSTSTTFGVVFTGANDVFMVHSIFGGAKTNAGIDASSSLGSHFALLANTDAGAYVNITGASGDIYYGPGSGYTNILPLYLPYAGIVAVSGNLQLPSGDTWINGIIAPNVGDSVLAVSVGNHSGGAIPVRNVVTFNRVDGRGVVNAFADNAADAGGSIGVSLGIGAGVGGFVAVSGNISINRDPESPFEGGGLPAYISAANPGQVTIHPPASTNVIRQIGWLSGESEVLLAPDNRPYLGLTAGSTCTGGVASFTADGFGAMTAATCATYATTSTTVQGTAPIAIAGDHAAHNIGLNRVWSLDANGVTYPFLQQGAALSIPGRAANSAGSWADIATTSSSNSVLREQGGNLGFGQIVEGAVTNLTTDLAAKVPTTRTLTMTAPMTCDGTGSCDLSGNRTIATAVFAGSTAGLVPSSSGVSTQFLNGAGAFAVPSGTVYTGTSPIVVSGSAISCPTCGTGTGSVTGVTATAPVVSSGGTAPNITLNIDATLAVVSSNLGRAAVSGDGSIPAGTNVFALNDVPNATPVLGSELFSNVVAPGTPASGKSSCYVDSTSLNYTCKNASGTLTNLIVPGPVPTSHFVTGVSATGVIASAQPTESDVVNLVSDLAGKQSILTWPAATDVNISTGPSSAPVGDSNFTFDTSTHTLVSALHTVLGGSVQLTGSAGSGEVLLGVGNTGFVELGFPGAGLSFAGGVLSLVPDGNPFHYEVTYGGPNFISDLPPNAFTGANPDFWLRPDSGFNASAGGPANFAAQGQVWEVDTGGSYTTVSLRAFVYQCGITTSSGVNDVTFTVTKNGVNTGVAIVASCPSSIAVNTDYSASGSVAFGPTDRVGIRGTVTNTGAYNSGVLRATAHLRLSP